MRTLSAAGLGRSRIRAIGMACLVAALGLAAPSAALAEDERQLRAGAATSNITPPLGVVIVGGWGQPVADHVHDELMARSLVLDDGENRLVIVLCDNVSIDRDVYDEAKRRLHEKTDIPIEHMLMSATHTHSGPSARQRDRLPVADELEPYQQFVADRIVDGVLTAINNLEPAQIGYGSGALPEQVNNRRWVVSDPEITNHPEGKPEQVRMNPPRGHEALVEPAGPTDPEIAFFSVRSVEGRPIALLANYSLHYVGGVPRGHISADYFSVFAARIGELLQADQDRKAPPFVGMLTNGTSGDVNNINFTESRPRRQPYEQIHIVANQVAAEVYRAYQTIEYQDHAELAGRKTELTLGVRKPTEEQLEWVRSIQAQSEDDVARREWLYAQRYQVAHENPDEFDIWVQAVRIGDIGIAAIPFETFTETGLEIKDQSPLPNTFTISLANGGYGYLPPPRHFELGGYETWLGTSRAEEQAVPKILERLMTHFEELTPSQ